MFSRSAFYVSERDFFFVRVSYRRVGTSSMIKINLDIEHRTYRNIYSEVFH